MSDHHEGRSPFKFFILTYIYAWVLWAPYILIGSGVEFGFDAAPIAVVVSGFGAFAPLAAALTLIVRRQGWKEGWQFIRSGFDFRTRPMYYILALAIPLVIHAVSHYLIPLFNLEVADTLIPEEMGNPWLIGIPYFFLIFIYGGGQEEYGWRGYAQQPLQDQFGVINASLLIGVVWALWHLPTWFMPGDRHSTYPFIAFMVMTVSTSVVYGWIYNASGKKLIIPWLFHAMSNTAAPLLPYLHWIDGKPETGYWVYAGVSVLAGLIAAFFIQRFAGASSPAPES